MKNFWEIVGEVVTGIIGLAILAVLVVNGGNTANVISSATGGFSNMVGTAEKG